MIASVEDFQKLAKDNTANAQKAFGSLSKGLQTIASEIGDYSKKSFEEGSAVLEQLAGAKTLDKVVEIQSDYAKKAYEGFVAQSTKVGELYVDLAKELAKPFEGMMPKAK
ncbi:MAG: phasin family protein [Siculibacillus sp.]|nr:phasin family protein [Siculibacillus sp.]